MDSTAQVVVAARSSPAEDVVQLELARADGGRMPDWTAGAHVDVVTPEGLVRQYSLCGDPRDTSRYRIAVGLEPGGRGGSRWVHDVAQVGTSVGLGGPRNTFRLAPSPEYLFVAGGIGITPILPMLAAADALGSTWRLLYLGRSRSGMAFADRLAALGDRVRLHVSAEEGRADVASWIGAPCADAMVYVCGSAAVLAAVQAATTGWRPGSVRAERFAPEVAAAPVREEAFEVEIPSRELVVTVPTGETVVGALRAAGVPVLTSCARGVCGTCEAAVLAGLPDHRDSVLSEAERRRNDCMLPCVSRSRSDRLVLEL